MKSKAIMGEEKRIGKGKKHREEMFYSSGSNSKCSGRRLKPRIGCRMKSKSENSNSSDDSTDITIASLKKQSSSSSRQSRSRTKKPKYVSLRLQLSPRSTEKSKPQMPPTADELNLFPLHDPEKEDIVGGNILPPEHDVISRYFFTSTDGIATTLTGLLTAAAVDRENELDEEAASRYNWGTEANSGSGEGSSAAAAADQESLLVRTAMRNREREVGEVEKWVSISEVVEKDVVRKRSMSKEEEEVSKRWKSKEEEVSSRWCEGVDLWRDRCGEGGGVGLKLDYEQVLSAWSDKGRCSLYIGDGSEHQSPPPLQPQTVPEMGDDYLSFTSGAADFVSGLWSVPESRCSAKEEKSMEGGSNRSSKLGQREASVLRYKEKRQSRLFAKKIRYQVRKLNAEKRPRIKGRFVKRS